METIQEYRKVQASIRDMELQKIKRQIKIVYPNISDDDMQKMAEGCENIFSSKILKKIDF